MSIDLAREACALRGLTGELELHRSTSHAAIWRLRESTHGPLAIRIDFDGRSGLAGKEIAVGKLLEQAGIDVIPSFDNSTLRHANRASSTIWYWIDDLVEGVEQVDISQAGVTLNAMHNVNGHGVDGAS